MHDEDASKRLGWNSKNRTLVCGDFREWEFEKILLASWSCSQWALISEEYSNCVSLNHFTPRGLRMVGKPEVSEYARFVLPVTGKVKF